MRLTIDTELLTAEEARTLCDSILDTVEATEKLRTSMQARPRSGSASPRTAGLGVGTKRDRILTFIRAAAPREVAVSDLMQASGAARQTIWLVLRELVLTGVVRKYGSTRDARWRLVSANTPPAEPGSRDGTDGGTTSEENTP